jgi:hypothetical protein
MYSGKRKDLKDKELEIAVQNEKKLQENRINYNNHIIPPPIVQKPTEEMFQNINSFEKLLKDNLFKSGFSYNLINGIIPILSVDEIIKINANWNHFETEIPKKFHIRIISPAFLKDYFNIYLRKLNKDIEKSREISLIEKQNDEDAEFLHLNHVEQINEELERIKNQKKEVLII